MEVPQMSAHFTDVWPMPGQLYAKIWFDLFAFDYMELDPFYTGTPYNVQHAKDLDNTHWTEEPLQQE